MSFELAAISVSLSNISERAVKDGQPLIAELVQQMIALCNVVKRLQEENPPAE